MKQPEHETHYDDCSCASHVIYKDKDAGDLFEIWSVATQVVMWVAASGIGVGIWKGCAWVARHLEVSWVP